MICKKCKKDVFDDGWSNYISKDNFSDEWGPVVCWIDTDGFLHEHGVEE